MLIGTGDWEFAIGGGIIKGYRWGTINGRISIGYERAEDEVELSEYAFEYLKRVSPEWRLIATLEGEDDELSLIGEAQWFFSEGSFLKLNSGSGISEKAANYAPEVGVLFSF